MDKLILTPSFHLTPRNLLLMSSYGLLFFGIWNIYLPNNMPSLLSSLYHYGKVSKTRNQRDQQSQFVSKYLQVPKRWFLHFYISAIILSSLVMWTIWIVYFRAGDCPAVVRIVLLWLSSPESRRATVAPESVTVASSLVFCQMVKRLYECLYVSIFSDSRMSVLHYAYGMGFYLLVCLSLLIEAPCFIEPCGRSSGVLRLWSSNWLAVHHVVGTLISLFGLHLEWQSNNILASLRKNKTGDVVTHQHRIPFGGWFKWVSCPHYLGEIIFYLGVNTVFGFNNATFYAVFVNVLVNQVLTANMSHEWYKKNFLNYPRNRKALLPFIY